MSCGPDACLYRDLRILKISRSLDHNEVSQIKSPKLFSVIEGYFGFGVEAVPMIFGADKESLGSARIFLPYSWIAQDFPLDARGKLQTVTPFCGTNLIEETTLLEQEALRQILTKTRDIVKPYHRSGDYTCLITSCAGCCAKPEQTVIVEAYSFLEKLNF